MASSQVHNHTPMYQRVGTRQNDHAAVGLASEHFDSTLEFCRIASANNCERHREGWHNGLDGTQHSHLGRGSEITHPCNSLDVRRDLRERFKPFSGHGIFKADKSRNIPTWMHQAIHKSGSDGIENLCENNRYRPSLLLHPDQCRQPTIHDDFRLERDKLSSVTFHHRRIPRGPSIVVDNIATLDPTEFLHPFAKRSHARLTFLILLRKVHEYANATAVTLLRPC